MTDNVQPRNANKLRYAWEGGSEGARAATWKGEQRSKLQNYKMDEVEPQPINDEKLRCALDSGSEGARVEARSTDETKQRETS